LRKILDQVIHLLPEKGGCGGKKSAFLYLNWGGKRKVRSAPGESLSQKAGRNLGLWGEEGREIADERGVSSRQKLKRQEGKGWHQERKWEGNHTSFLLRSLGSCLGGGTPKSQVSSCLLARNGKFDVRNLTKSEQLGTIFCCVQQKERQGRDKRGRLISVERGVHGWGRHLRGVEDPNHRWKRGSEKEKKHESEMLHCRRIFKKKRERPSFKFSGPPAYPGKNQKKKKQGGRGDWEGGQSAPEIGTPRSLTDGREAELHGPAREGTIYARDSRIEEMKNPEGDGRPEFIGR